MPCNERWGMCSLPCCKSRFSRTLIVLSALPSLPLLLTTSALFACSGGACKPPAGTCKTSYLYIDNVINMDCSGPSTPSFPYHGSSLACPSLLHSLPTKVTGRRLVASPAEPCFLVPCSFKPSHFLHVAHNWVLSCLSQ